MASRTSPFIFSSSGADGGRFSSPITSRRTWVAPTKLARLIPMPCFSSRAKYWRKVRQSTERPMCS